MNAVVEQIRSAVREQRWLQYLAQREFDDDADEEVRWAAATELHNAGDIDLLDALNEFDGNGEIRFFAVMRFYSRALPGLEAEPAAMLTAVRRLVGKGGPNRDGGAFGPALKQWCSVGDRAKAVAALLDPNEERVEWYLRLVLEGASRSDADDAMGWAITLLESGAGWERRAALDSISALGMDDQLRAQRALEALQRLATASDDDDTLSRAMLAAVEIHGSAGGAGETETCSIIDRAVALGEGEMRMRGAMALWFQWKTVAAAVLERLVAISKTLQSGDDRALDIIDHALYQMLGDGKVELAIEIVATVLVANRGALGIQSFYSFSDHLLVDHTRRFETVAVEWLVSGERALGEAVMSMAVRVHGEPIFFTVDLAPFGYNAATLIFLCRKAVGYLFSTPVTAASLLLAVMRTGVPDAVQAATELLTDPILLNYSGDTADYLRDHCQKEGDPATPHVATALAQLETYIAGLKAVGRLKAFNPSERERIIEWRRRQEEMEVAMKEGEKDSFLSHIATKMILLHGNRAITWMGEPDGTGRRMVNDMQSYSHSVESARMITVDPLGLELMLRRFRAERMQ